MTEPVNLFDLEVSYDADDPVGYVAGYARVRPLVGGKLIGASVYELERGQSVCPYHYEYGNEEWLLVLVGRPTLRHPGGEDELSPGDVVCFPDGPAGAHKVTNTGEERVRVVMVSTQRDPGVAVYPDSDKIGIFPPNAEDKLIGKRSSGVDYWEGEAAPS